MTLPLSRGDVEQLRREHTGDGFHPRKCPECAPLQLHPCPIYQVADAALQSPRFTTQEVA